MIFDRIVESMIGDSAIVAVLAAMLWMNWKLVGKLIELVQTNTKALTNNSAKFMELTAAQERRRHEFNS